MGNRAFRIEGWEPGSTNDTIVSIVEILYNGSATKSFLSRVRLEDARLILGCLNHCIEQKKKLAMLTL